MWRQRRRGALQWPSLASKPSSRRRFRPALNLTTPQGVSASCALHMLSPARAWQHQHLHPPWSRQSMGTLLRRRGGPTTAGSTSPPSCSPSMACTTCPRRGSCPGSLRATTGSPPSVSRTSAAALVGLATAKKARWLAQCALRWRRRRRRGREWSRRSPASSRTSAGPL
jgi:hypothetical protein